MKDCHKLWGLVFVPTTIVLAFSMCKGIKEELLIPVRFFGKG